MRKPLEITKEDIRTEELSETGSFFVLVLFNDDHNTFDHVIQCLVDVCSHDDIQANQCAMIAHFNGKCDVKKSSSFDELKRMKTTLVEKGLSVVIEKV